MIGLNSTAVAGQGPLVSNVGNLGISFSGAGFLIFYYIGIVEVLTKLGVLHQGAQVAASPGSDERSANPAYPPISSTGDNGTADPSLLSLANAKGVDIAPGVWNKMPFTPEQWTSWAYTPADDTTLMHMVALGRADAELWAKANGLLPAEQSTVQLQPTSAPPSTAGTSSAGAAGEAGAAGAGAHEHDPQLRQEAGATAAAPKHNAQPAPAAGTMMRPHPGRRFGRLR
eukprot:gene8758-8937_t